MSPESTPRPLSPVPAEFDEAMRRLVRVPKEALEAEERKYKAQRARLRQKKQRKPKA